MAIVTTKEFDGVQPVPAPCEVGEIYEVKIVVDTATTNLASGDLVQLMSIPANAVVTDIRVGSSATTATATIAVGTALLSTDTTLTGATFVAAAASNGTAMLAPTAAILADAPSATNSRILAAKIAVAAITSPVLYFAVQYRASRYGA